MHSYRIYKKTKCTLYFECNSILNKTFNETPGKIEKSYEFSCFFKLTNTSYWRKII
ncbi:hypothetical protein HanPI659440_Chr13g0484181 [Helianthus annuus]|nr:hypothetical protein HanPI659440_Chr13g0484181 [Helianthus annuus]